MGGTPSKTSADSKNPNTKNSKTSKPSVKSAFLSKPIIMVLGGPGTGKGTQCERMVKEFGFKHISLGDILRAEVKNGSQIGKDCAAIMKEGKLVPMKLTMQLMQKAIKQAPDASGFLLDGFPRAVSQAKEFQKLMRAPDMVLYLHAPSQVLIHRLMQRGQSSGRADDNVKTINKRLITFKKESLPVISYYEKIKSVTLKKVCTVTTPDDVYKQVREAIKKAINSPRERKRYEKVVHKVVHHRKRKRYGKVVHKVVRRRKRRRKRRKKTTNMEECPGHPSGSPVPPAPPPPPPQCMIM